MVKLLLALYIVSCIHLASALRLHNTTALIEESSDSDLAVYSQEFE